MTTDDTLLHRKAHFVAENYVSARFSGPGLGKVRMGYIGKRWKIAVLQMIVL